MVAFTDKKYFIYNYSVIMHVQAIFLFYAVNFSHARDTGSDKSKSYEPAILRSQGSNKIIQLGREY